MSGIYQVTSNLWHSVEGSLTNIGKKGIVAVQRCIIPAASSTPAWAIGSIAFNLLKMRACYVSLRTLNFSVRDDAKKDFRLAALRTTGRALLAFEILRSGLSIANEAVGLFNQKGIVALVGLTRIAAYVPNGSVVLGVSTVAGGFFIAAAALTSALTLCDAYVSLRRVGYPFQAGVKLAGAGCLVFRVGQLFWLFCKTSACNCRA